ncbi:SWIM zinc finger family protein [Nocardiopsis ansamitocini]|uniref:SWIM-type domain-containing protein n=1 Tax=Nocardiopsis ansamitocini TaxID=1670832 RepID=A0A9W6P710_9ACTN|nr:SWIM zinc finger family protein [Nocardiopsis ansamitocini]GLU48173.1 hypothetical protein Nans01_25240 [Nocardiopsis ansamitocini]
MSARRWWSQRFVSALESGTEDGRLARGRAYAASGAVLEVKVRPGEVVASVRGSRSRPYRVSLIGRVLDDAQWEVVVAALAGQPLFRARLLSGELPAEVEQVFDVLGLDLFPRGLHDLVLTCSCQDWGHPCKHTAAALYVMAERLDGDPFLLTAWLGRDRAALLSQMRLRARAGAEPVSAGTEPSPPATVAAAPLPDDPREFWSAPPLPRPHRVTVAPPFAPKGVEEVAAAVAPLLRALTAQGPGEQVSGVDEAG